MLHRENPELFRTWVVVSAFWIAFVIFSDLNFFGLAPFLYFKGACVLAAESFLPPILTNLVLTTALWTADITRRAWMGR